MPPRNPLSRRIRLGGVVVVVALTLVVWTIVTIGTGWPLGVQLGAFAVVALFGVSLIDGWFHRTVLGPLEATEQVAVRVARGDLRVTEGQIQAVGGGPLTDAVRLMVHELRRLLDAIKLAAQESASLSQEISQATHQVMASTEGVAGTTSDLADRAISQATLI